MGKKFDWKQPWVIRKAVYFLVATLSLVGVGLGAISQAQADELWNHVDEVIQLVSMFVLMLAAAKTHEGSDSRATDEQLLEARDAAARVVNGNA